MTPLEKGGHYTNEMKNLKISILQVIVFSAMFYVFLTNAAWLFTKPISAMSELQLEQNPNIPEGAKYFTVGHGKVSFITDSRKENPLRFYGVLTFILACWIILIMSSKEAREWLKYKKKKRLTNGST